MYVSRYFENIVFNIIDKLLAIGVEGVGELDIDTFPDNVTMCVNLNKHCEGSCELLRQIYLRKLQGMFRMLVTLKEPIRTLQ